MWRLIVITFGFLGIAFYQLSGGADYAPSEGSRQHAALTAAQPVAVTEAATISPAKPATPPQNRAKIVLASAEDDVAKSDAGKRLRLTLNSESTPKADLSDTTGVTTVVADPAKIERLVAAAATSVHTAEPSSETLTSQDVRVVKSARVNMRSGPGKEFEVLGKLTRGTEVAVLRDDGDGWVKLRVIDSGTVGWMADFLLVASN